MQLALTLTPVDYQPGGASIYQVGDSETVLNRSIVHTAGAVENCGRPAGDALARVTSKGTNVMRPEAVDGRAGESSCVETDGDILEDPLLGPLQDNNQIDYDAKTVSGYTENHALLPGSPAIDALGDSNCLAGVVHDIDAASPVSLTLPAGAIVSWTSATTATVVFGDGEYNARLVELGPNAGRRRDAVRRAAARTCTGYTTGASRDAGGSGMITVADRRAQARSAWRAVPQRGPNGGYRCDIGAYEFQQWVVGQPMPTAASVEHDEGRQDGR